MNNYQERVSLLSEMIAFSVVDGRLHEREYLFLTMIADELQIPRDDFKNLFHQEEYPIVVKSEFERIQQFYRLALLMQKVFEIVSSYLEFISNHGQEKIFSFM